MPPTIITANSSQDPLSAYNIKVGVPQLHVTPYGSSANWNEVEGWLPLGLVEPGTVKFDFTKEKYDVMAGSPQTVKARFIVGHAGKVDLSLFEIDPRARELSLGHNIGQADSIKAATSGAVAGTPTATSFDYDTAPATAPQAGDRIKLTVTDAQLGGTRVVYGRVQSFSGSTVTLTDPLEMIPTAADVIDGVVEYHTHQIGGNYFKNYRARIMMSATDDSLSVVELLKVNVTTGFAPDFKDGKQAAILPLSMECIGLTQTVGTPARKQVVLARYYEMPKMFLA